MATIASHRCVQHPSREAVARCPHCQGHFCRECVVEHDGQVLCTACLARLPAEVASRAGAIARTARFAMTVAAAAAAWLFFYWIGATLVRIPPEYHEGSVWRRDSNP